jgi:tripartite-type tricarboxylate transporter receptor subunit TctC
MGSGSSADTHGRILMEEVKEILKTEVVVINKPGPSMTIGTDFVVRSKKYGDTIPRRRRRFYRQKLGWR